MLNLHRKRFDRKIWAEDEDLINPWCSTTERSTKTIANGGRTKMMRKHLARFAKAEHCRNVFRRWKWCNSIHFILPWRSGMFYNHVRCQWCQVCVFNFCTHCTSWNAALVRFHKMHIFCLWGKTHRLDFWHQPNSTGGVSGICINTRKALVVHMNCQAHIMGIHRLDCVWWSISRSNWSGHLSPMVPPEKRSRISGSFGTLANHWLSLTVKHWAKVFVQSQLTSCLFLEALWTWTIHEQIPGQLWDLFG